MATGPKYKYGDRVVTHRGHTGRIVSVFTKKTGEYWCTIKFDNENLIPSEYDYPESYFTFQTPSEESCPICSTRWTITKFNNQVWKDCKICKKTSEELIEKFNKAKEEEKKINLDFFDKKEDDDDDDDDDFPFVYF